jgi:AraC-like DNA-binding protein
VALGDIDELVRPASLGGGVEIAIASAAPRTFPTRVSQSLGVCLKVGPAHSVMADGRWREYPADAISVRPPGCVWSSSADAAIAFISIDIAASLLPDEEPLVGSMEFIAADQLVDLRALVRQLLAPGPQLEKQEAVSGLLTTLCEHRLIVARELADREAPRGALERARSLLDASLASNPSLDTVATAARMNKHVLVRRFRARYGATPHSYLVMAKIDRARELLARGAPPAEIAAILGFADQAHLSRAFRKRVGLTPGTYQRRVRAVG